MKTITVTRDSWSKCFSHEYRLRGNRDIRESVNEKYGIEHWEKINLDEFKITFVDDKKMTYWLLKWS